jgi:hypothetical protein
MKNFNVGRRYAKGVAGEYHPNGAPALPRSKPARRLIRAGLKRAYSSIERNVMNARGARLEVERMVTNSHEAKRYVAAARTERNTYEARTERARVNFDALKAFASR